MNQQSGTRTADGAGGIIWKEKSKWEAGGCIRCASRCDFVRVIGTVATEIKQSERQQEGCTGSRLCTRR